MDHTLIKLSLERLLTKLESLKLENEDLKNRINSLEIQSGLPHSQTEEVVQDDQLLDTKEVLKILGISYNTLQAVVGKKLIVPIRINQRRIRYSKKGVYDYISSLYGV